MNLFEYLVGAIVFLAPIIVAIWWFRSGRWSTLFDLAYCGEIDKVRRLLDTGIDVNLRDEDGRTALFSAIKGGECEIAQLLIERGADVGAQDLAGRTPLLLILATEPFVLNENPEGWKKLREYVEEHSSFRYVREEK